MGEATSRRKTLRRVASLLAANGLVVGMLIVLSTDAAAVVNSCRARDVTKGTAFRTNLQNVIDAASAGDTIAVKRVCVGHFKISKKLTLVGKATDAVPKPILNGNGTNRTLAVSARVTLTNLKITGGVTAPTDNLGGGGIKNTGRLVLKNTIVSGNTSPTNGGGIYNNGTLILNGRSSVSGNSSDFDGGGIINGADGVLILNDRSSVKNNTAGVAEGLYGRGGGIYNGVGPITMNDSSTVSANSAIDSGGGILNYGPLTMNDSSSISGNTADADDVDGGGWETGGGILNVECYGSLDGAVDGGNVDDNDVGSASPFENNIVNQSC